MLLSERRPFSLKCLGYGSSADAFRITDIHPKGDGAVFAMQGAMADAGLTPADIEYINAHGTSTVQNDQIETLAIKRVWERGRRKFPSAPTSR